MGQSSNRSHSEVFLVRSMYLLRTNKETFLSCFLSSFPPPLSSFLFSPPLPPLQSMTFTWKCFCFDNKLQASKDQHCFLGDKTVASLRIQSKPECTKWKINQGHHYSVSLWFGLPSNLIPSLSEIAGTPPLAEPSNTLIKVSFRIKRQKCRILITLLKSCNSLCCAKLKAVDNFPQKPASVRVCRHADRCRF